MAYCPKHIKQQAGSSDCGPSSLGMAVDFASLGVVRPKADTIRDVINDYVAGTNPDQWVEFCNKMGMVSAKVTDVDLLRNALNSGKGAVIAVDYAQWKNAGLPGYTSFTGWHAIMIHRQNGNIHVHDPLTTDGVMVNEDKLFAFLRTRTLAIVLRNSAWLRNHTQPTEPPPPAEPSDREVALEAALKEATAKAEGIRIAAENTVELVDDLQVLFAHV